MKVRRSLLTPIALCVFALPLGAQTKAKAAPAPKPPILMLAILGAGCLAAGVAIGSLLKKKPAPVVIAEGTLPVLFEEIPMPLAVLNSKEKIQQANSAFLNYFGLKTPEEVTLTQLFHPDDMAKNRTLVHEILGGDRQDFSVATRFFHPEGAMLHARFYGRKQGTKRKPETVLIAIEDSTRKVEAEAESEGAKEAIHALYDVIAGDKDRKFDAKIKALLSMGCNLFDLPIGALCHLTSQDEVTQLETLYVQSQDRRIRPALKLPLNGEHTAEAILLGVPFMANPDSWRDTPYITYNGETAYFAAPVVADNALFGMLSFSKPDTHDRDFSSGDVEVLQLMAEWVGGEIERENAQRVLQEQKVALQEANTKLESLARIDSLTEIKNRRAFNEKLQEEWARSARYRTPLSMVLLDVDNFKSYNDSFGHPAGDEVLKKVASVLDAAVRGTDFLARYGGEEFVLLLPNTDADGAMILAERLRQKIADVPWKERPVTVSLGVGSTFGGPEPATDLTTVADGALYGSKAAGRNRVTHARDMPTKQPSQA